MRAPLSLKKMGGSEARQEGIYASLDLSSSSRLLLQNDLGLTLLPGSQIEEESEEPPEDLAGGDHRHLLKIDGCINIPLNDVESQTLKDPALQSLQNTSDAETASSQSNEDTDNTLTLIEGNGEALSRNQSGEEGPLQRLSSRQELLNLLGNVGPQYSQRVRALTETPQGDNPCKRRRTGLLTENITGEHIIPAVSIPEDSSSNQSKATTSTESSPSEDRPAVFIHPSTSISLSPQRSSSLASGKFAQSRAQSSTSIYPQCSKRKVASENPSSVEYSLPPQSPSPTEKKSLVEESACQTPARALKMLQSELKQTRKDLFQKTRAESDAKHAIFELSKAYHGLLATAEAHLNLEKIHTKLLEEHRRLLDSYDSLAKVHAVCRSTSSRKLAQRIIDAAPSSQRAAYPCPTPSPSITACSTLYGSYTSSNTATRSYPATPMIDLTRSPSPAPASLLQSSCMNSLPNEDQESQRDASHDPNYANMNGFDDEANEMFNALWESEMGELDSGNGASVEA